MSESEQLAQIRDALNIVTCHLSRATHCEVVRLVDQLSQRVRAEEWARSMGWRIPAYQTPEWQELFAAWIDGE
jgi:hypothetical protein